MDSNVKPSVERIRLAGLACLTGGLLWAVLVSVDLLEAVPPLVPGLLIPLPMLLCLACGPLGLLILRASGKGRMRRVGFIGTFITLLGICSYLAATLSQYIVGYEVEFFYPVGALLVGVGMLMLGIAVFVARRLTGWHRIAPLFVGVYYVAMIPFQIIFFIIPNGEPSPILLGFWSVTWILLGYSIWSSASSFERLSTGGDVSTAG
ncbi:hypothetical protein [Lederbergia citri]|uniref:Uncharacterized protein n=1 Tax=Lederbergia citri TaxID=2833580 RepID=A0A942YIE0_9BACI|nr:hypothetical protein [Lederbergia citri]MBS4196370.1 hypothetical protein [Lederbergia citri]